MNELISVRVDTKYIKIYSWEYFRSETNDIHEVFHKERRFFLDYDAKLSDLKSGQAEAKTDVEIISDIHKVFGDVRIAAFTSSDISKLSFHFVLCDVIMEPAMARNIVECKFPYVDTKVYNSIQCLRCPNSTKGTRKKRLYVPNCPGNFENRLSRECFVQVHMLESWPEKSKITMSSSESKYENFELRYGSDHIYNRLNPSYCKICERMHENDAISINAAGYVYCFRSKRGSTMMPKHIYFS